MAKSESKKWEDLGGSVCIRAWFAYCFFACHQYTGTEHDLLCNQGGGYLVNAEDPELWGKVLACPVIDFRPLPEHEILVFSDFTGLAAYGKNGFVWRSPRLCWDDLKITNVTSATIESTGYDPTNSVTREMRFAVDLRTGRSLIPPPVAVDGTAVW